MKRLLFSLYALVCYSLFLLTFLYAIGFVADLLVPKTIDSGETSGVGAAIVVNLILLSIFALQHSIMARRWFKAWWTKYIPEPIERSTFVLLSSLSLILIFAGWQAMPAMVWSIEQPLVSALIWAICVIGWLIVLTSTFLINHFDLFGLRQVYLFVRDRPYSHVEFKTRLFYKLVRHPLMLGFVIAFWATLQMSQGHLLFALVTTAYILIAIQFEEHDLRHHLGESYDAYRQQVSMIVPGLKRSRT